MAISDGGRLKIIKDLPELFRTKATWQQNE